MARTKGIPKRRLSHVPVVYETRDFPNLRRMMDRFKTRAGKRVAGALLTAYGELRCDDNPEAFISWARMEGGAVSEPDALTVVLTSLRAEELVSL
jgi:hypothetical protein